LTKSTYAAIAFIQLLQNVYPTICKVLQKLNSKYMTLAKRLSSASTNGSKLEMF